MSRGRAWVYLWLAACAACGSGDPADDGAQPSPGPRPVVPPVVSAPVVLGELAGPKAHVEPPGLRVYGTDMGLSYDHRGRSFIAFGDTWPYAKFICDNHAPHNDDTLAEMPKTYEGDVPVLDFVTHSVSP